MRSGDYGYQSPVSAKDRFQKGVPLCCVSNVLERGPKGGYRSGRITSDRFGMIDHKVVVMMVITMGFIALFHFSCIHLGLAFLSFHILGVYLLLAVDPKFN